MHNITLLILYLLLTKKIVYGLSLSVPDFDLSLPYPSFLHGLTVLVNTNHRRICEMKKDFKKVVRAIVPVIVSSTQSVFTMHLLTVTVTCTRSFSYKNEHEPT